MAEVARWIFVWLQVATQSTIWLLSLYRQQLYGQLARLWTRYAWREKTTKLLADCCSGCRIRTAQRTFLQTTESKKKHEIIKEYSVKRANSRTISSRNKVVFFCSGRGSLSLIGRGCTDRSNSGYIVSHTNVICRAPGKSGRHIIWPVQSSKRQRYKRRI